MQHIAKRSALVVAMLGLLLLASCSALDNDFGDLNINPTQADQINPNYKLTNIQLRISGERYENWRTNLIYSSVMIQHFATLPTYWAGDKYLYIGSYSAAMWDRYYPNIARNIEDLLVQVCEDPADANFCAIAQITRVVMYHRLTDLYGDVPYSEAGRGFIDGITQPVYDPQQEIYMDMLNRLEQAVAMLDPSLDTYGTGDLIYEGDVDKWRKFAFSLMLRLGMRMSEVDAPSAQQWVQKAIAGGVMESNDDNAAVPHDPAGWANGNGSVYLADGSMHISEYFLGWMQDRNDPRIDVYGQVPVAGAPAVGLPNGYDSNTIQDHPSWIPCTSTDPPTPSPCEMAVYMDVNPVMWGQDDPMFFQTYAEVELLLAEAAVRNWGAPLSAMEHYENGVRAAMSYLAAYGAGAAISDAAIDAYLAANPFDAANALEQIAEQYWAAVLLNEYEAYANWRRTGYPELTPTNYPGNVTNGTIPLRLRYPEGESVANASSYQAAISRQGPDEFTTPVWWDAD